MKYILFKEWKDQKEIFDDELGVTIYYSSWSLIDTVEFFTITQNWQ